MNIKPFDEVHPNLQKWWLLVITKKKIVLIFRAEHQSHSPKCPFLIIGKKAMESWTVAEFSDLHQKSMENKIVSRFNVCDGNAPIGQLWIIPLSSSLNKAYLSIIPMKDTQYLKLFCMTDNWSMMKLTW